MDAIKATFFPMAGFPGTGVYNVTIKTGYYETSGTNNEISIILIDETGQKSQKLYVNRIGIVGSGSEYKIAYRNLSHLKDVKQVEVTIDGLIRDDWFLEYVIVENHNMSMRRVFPVHRWMPHGIPHRVTEYDSMLPQDDPNVHQRKEEIFRQQQRYVLKPKAPGFPPQVVDMPIEDSFTPDERFAMTQRTLTLAFKTKMKAMMTGVWDEIMHMEQLFDGKSFPLPESFRDDWDTDEFFGRQRVQGCNPNQIKLCEEIPENFAVEEDEVEEFLEGLSLDQAVEDKRIFIQDLIVLENLDKPDNMVLPVPMALFFRRENNELVPIAIQLWQEPGPDNPVFLPSDPKYTWLVVKMWFNACDSCVHQSASHLGMTHLIMECLYVCTHRNLSPSHPVYRLMKPHWHLLLAINTRGLPKLISPGGWVDNALSCGRLGMMDLIVRHWATYRMDVNGKLPKEIESRGVMDPEILPYYPYRDDAMLLYNIIRKYVHTCVSSYYPDEKSILGDWELQAWVKELETPVEKGGGNYRGVSRDGSGSISTVDEIVDIVVFCIQTCSVQHAAVNFNQYHDYAFTPARPMKMHGDPPRSKAPLTEADVLAALPSKKEAFGVMLFGKLLSERATQELGNFEVTFAYDPPTLAALKTFQEDLKEAEKTMQQRNRDRFQDYNVLYPSLIPNAISI